MSTELTATLTDPGGSITGTTWVWANSDDGSTAWTDITGATAASYTPVDADVGKYLRATASYTDGHGGGKSAQAVSANQVEAEPVINIHPIFSDGPTTTRSVAENSPQGTNVGTAVSATDADSLIYRLSGTSAASFVIGASSGQITVGTGTTLDYESKNSYEVEVTATDTITVTITVTNVDEPGVVILSPAQPQVSTELTATLTDQDGSISATTWVWANSDDGSTNWSDISGATSADTTSAYTPVDGDVGKYLRATASYTDGHGGGKSAQAVSSNVGQAAPNNPPAFPEDTAIRSIAENTGARTDIGAAVTATDTDMLTYSLSGTDQTSFDIVSTSGQLQTRATLDYESKNSYEVAVTATDPSSATATITVTINVTNVNEAPIATGDTASIAEDTAVEINVVANDTDPDAGAKLMVTLVSTATTSGTAVIKSGSATTVIYTPNADFNGTDTFEYTLSDGSLTDTGTVKVVVYTPAPTSNTQSTQGVPAGAETNAEAPVAAWQWNSHWAPLTAPRSRCGWTTQRIRTAGTSPLARS